MTNPIIQTSEGIYFVSRKAEIADTLFKPINGRLYWSYQYCWQQGGIENETTLETWNGYKS